MYSLRQKKYFAQKAGQTTVTLTMEEVDHILAVIAEMDRKLAMCMEYAPKHILDQFAEELGYD